MTQRHDTNPRRRRGALRRKILKEVAVPSIFPHYPRHLLRTRHRERSGASSSSSRMEVENFRLETEILAFEEADVIDDLDMLVRKFCDSSSKPNFFLLPGDSSEKRVFLNVDVSNDPTLKQSITVFEDLSFVALDEHKNVIPDIVYNDVMQFPLRISRFSDFLNLLAAVSRVTTNATIENAVDILSTVCDSETSSEKVRKLGFLIEQLQLLCRSPGPLNRYSGNLLTMAILWKAHSTACYKSILHENVLTMPSLRTLRRIGQKFTNLNKDTLEYLKLRSSKLNSHEKSVILLFDEMYVFQSVEYQNGAFVGLSTESGEPAKTLLCFMIKSFSSSFADIVAAIPTNRLVVENLKTHFLQVLDVVMKAGFDVVALCCDNHPVNRSFYNTISNRDINSPCMNPCNPHKQLFLLIDPVHTIKNVYNNFQKRGVFQFHDNRFLPANFSHIKDMYNLESEMLLRKAHKLNCIVLNPSNIQRVSAKLAFSLFHESTVGALRYYCTTHPAWNGTCDFLSYFTDLVKILNIRTATVGGRHRDDLQVPFCDASDDRLKMLLDYAEFFEAWHFSGKPGLSAETFAAIINACRVVRLIVLHLLQKCDFQFALTGHIQSDAIESRFGQYRQMAGGNFYVSIKQVLESEKKIKMVSLLKHSGIPLSDIAESNEIELSSAQPLALESLPPCEISESEQEIIFYVAGYCANKMKSIKCNSCLSFILSDSNLPPVDQPTSFFESVNRGGLKCPAKDAFDVCYTAYRVFCVIKSSPEFGAFLKLSSPRDVFVSTVIAYLHEKCVCALSCSANHDVDQIWCKIIVTFFNCLVRNFLRSLDFKDNVDASARKIHKLRSNRI